MSYTIKDNAIVTNDRAKAYVYSIIKRQGQHAFIFPTHTRKQGKVIAQSQAAKLCQWIKVTDLEAA